MDRQEILKVIKTKGKMINVQKDSLEFKRFFDELIIFEQNLGLLFSLDRLINDNKVSKGNKVNSYLLYLLDIVDGLPDFNKPPEFAKDWYPTRFSPPDIDMDFENNRLVQERAEEKYKENFIYIGTYGQWKPKAAIQNASKFNNFCIPGHTAASTAIILSKAISKYDTSDFETAVSGDEFMALRRQYPELEKIVNDAKKVCGQKNNTGKHAGGVIICDVPVHEVCPYFVVEEVIDQKKTGRWIRVSQFNDKDCELLGLLKADFLGVKTLQSLHLAVDMIKARIGREIDLESIDVFDRSQNEKVLDLFRKGITGAIFQFEGYNITKFLTEMQPTCFDDLVAANALFRPGPRDNGYTTEYCRRKKNPQLVKTPHYELDEILEDTYGLWVYQEQLMKGAGKLAGFNPTEQDELRRIIGKKDLKKLPGMKEKFIQRCEVQGLINKEVAFEIWDQFEKFGNYAFNRSHCLSGDTKVFSKKDKHFCELESLADRENGGEGVVIDSFKNGEIVEDEIVRVYCTGNQNLLEFTLSNGFVVKCTFEHKFLCDDNVFRTMKEIFNNDLLFITNGVTKVRVVSAKYLGSRKTYNISMKSEQHNYIIYDEYLKNYVVSKNSASYAKIAYQTAFLKHYFPVEFYAANMTRELRNHSPGDEASNLLNYETEAARFFGIKLLEPSVNHSKTFYNIEYHNDLPYIRKPLTYISGIGEEIEKEIVSKQPYKSIEDFCKKSSSKVLGVKTIGSLIDAGTLNEFGTTEFIQNEYMRCKEIMENASRKQSSVMKKMAPRMNGVL